MYRNKIRICVSLILLAGSVYAATNDVAVSATNQVEEASRHQKNEQRREKIEQRRVQLMERELHRIGVTEEEKVRIMALQAAFNERIKESAKTIEQARHHLTALMDASSSMELLEEAIQAVANAQADQLRILVNNRLEMERLLGKEKYAAFMKNARVQYQKQGRRSTPPMPPRADLPPLPGQKSPKTPPLPSEAPPVPPAH